MIRKNRGLIFGTRGKSRGQQTMRVGQNPYRMMSNMPTQFGRSTNVSPVFGNRQRALRRR
jgi:hypothetical protein